MVGMSPPALCTGCPADLGFGDKSLQVGAVLGFQVLLLVDSLDVKLFGGWSLGAQTLPGPR